MAELGLRYAVRAQWDNALPLLQGSYARNPTQPGIYRPGLVLHHYARGAYQEALSEARRIGVTHNLFGAIFVAICAAQLGLRQETDDALRALLEIDPQYGRHVVADLQVRQAHPDVSRLIVEGLRKAGLPITEAAPADARHSA